MTQQPTMQFLESVVRFETLLWLRVERELALSDMPTLSTLMSLRILRELDEEGRVHDLSRALAITVGAASKLVDRLERDGLAKRRPHPGDRRSSLIALTPAGSAAASAGSEVADAALADLFDRADAARILEALVPLQERLDTAKDDEMELA